MKAKIKILVTAVGSTTALSVVKALRQSTTHECHIVGTDANPLHVAGAALCDAFYYLPHVKSGVYMDTLASILDREQIDVFIPIIDVEIEHIGRHLDQLGPYAAHCLIPPASVSAVCNDKYALYEAVRGHASVGVPQTHAGDDALQEDDLPFPVFIKPRRGISSIDCFQVANRRELEVFLARIDDPIVSHFLHGEQYVIDTLSDTTGTCLLSVPRREFEAKAGVGVKAQICLNDRLMAYGRELVETLGLVGPACIEVMKDEDRIGLIEVNPRPSASLTITVEAGVNVPALIVDLVQNKAIEPGRCEVRRPDLYMCRYWQEIYFDGAWSE
jgi:carbamoyl-phosphate synthase large subunit